MTQSRKLSMLAEPTTPEELVSTRAALQYIAGCTRPDLCSASQLLSKAVTEPGQKVYKELATIVRRANETADMGLSFVNLEMDSLQVVLFTDASFANAEKSASQLGFVVCLVDGNNSANIIHFGSQRCRRVTRSVMAAELLALSYGFDHAFVAKKMVEGIFGKNIPINALIDSRTVFNTISRSGQTLEKRLQIDAYALRQSHQRGELYSLAWIPSNENIADALTKSLPNLDHALYALIRNNKLYITPTGWVHHTSLIPAKEKKSECRGWCSDKERSDADGAPTRKGVM